MTRKILMVLAALLLAEGAVYAAPKKKKKKKKVAQTEIVAQPQTEEKVETPVSEVVKQDEAPATNCVEIDAQQEQECDLRTPEQRAADSIADLRQRLKPCRIKSTFEIDGLTVIDTLESGHDAVKVVLFSNNTWKYVRNRDIPKDSTIFVKYWNTQTLFPYREVDMSKMPRAVVIELLDSLTSYHYPYKGAVHPRGKYGPRRHRQHQGVDLPLKMGDPIYATFSGRVRISQYNRGGYGNLVIIRHDNGLETYYGHLSERMVEPNQWVEAGQVIGLGGSTGRSTGPHLHFETRYYGQSFDPERLINFQTGELCRETFLLKKSFFSIYSKAGQDFEDEIANEEQDKKEAAEAAARRYHTIRSGDTLGALARRYHTSVSAICRMNGIKSTTILRLGRKLRVR